DVAAVETEAAEVEVEVEVEDREGAGAYTTTAASATSGACACGYVGVSPMSITFAASELEVAPVRDVEVESTGVAGPRRRRQDGMTGARGGGEREASRLRALRSRDVEEEPKDELLFDLKLGNATLSTTCPLSSRSSVSSPRFCFFHNGKE
ncbi:hypothetical protein C8F04DRAFT_1132892, partial [Mycena alexandri]